MSRSAFRSYLKLGSGFCFLLAMCSFLSGCIRPQNYHTRPNSSVLSYRYRSDHSQGYGTGYFSDANAHECYIEFDARGSLYRDQDDNPTQLNKATELIRSIKADPLRPGKTRRIAVYIFVHGWKNNASEDSGNVWGFRRFLSDIAAQQSGIPVIGVYMGWPGASLKGDQFLSFWNREPIADAVGQSADFRDALKGVLQATKGESYDSPEHSIAIAIGHSFGGIVLEHAATELLDEQIAKATPKPGDQERRADVTLPADLFVLINEAGAASIGLPFLKKLKLGEAEYTRVVEGQKRLCPLLLSMTSTGDVATKFAYPGGEFLSFNRPKTTPLSPTDTFGQSSTLPYNLLTAANMVALQSHHIVPLTGIKICDGSGLIPIRLAGTQSYCMEPLDTSLSRNKTPYWIMQLPQVFVPDHSSVFQDYLLNLITDVLIYEGVITRPSHSRVPVAQPNAVPLHLLIAPLGAPPAPTTPGLTIKR